MSNNDVEKTVKDGFSFGFGRASITELALLSLRTALQAFSKTYQDMRWNLDLLKDPGDLEQKQIDSLYDMDYITNYTETIIHLQHFAELVCKDILRSIHPLLSIDASPKPSIYHKLLFGESVSQSDWEGLKSIEFSETLKRIKSLIAAGKLPKESNFIAEYDLVLGKLNELRNRTWHRGTYILRYQALDVFVVKYVLPFVVSVIALPQYENKDRLWIHKKLSCNINPITALLDSRLNANYDLGRVAFFKEMLRASYQNPLIPVPEKGFGRSSIIEHNTKTRQHTEELAKARYSLGDVHSIRKCPVCGVQALLLYITTEMEGDALEPERIWSSTSSVECLCCSFAIGNELKNPQEYGVNQDDYWVSTS